MTLIDPIAAIDRHLRQLSCEIGSRPVGSEANRRAQAYIAQALAAAGCAVEEQAFPCLDWQLDHVALALGDQDLAVRANPFSPPLQITAPTVLAGSLEELTALDMAGKIAVLHGELAGETLFPKNFPFFHVEAHRRILDRLENGRPLAVIMAANDMAPPVPLIEDGDFTLPSVTLAREDTPRLLGCVAAPVTLCIETRLRPSMGANVIGRKPGAANHKVVICAHFDTKHGTPGALDNAAGVAALLALAESAPLPEDAGLEFVAFDGEENYAAPGEVAYLADYGHELPDSVLAINIDGVGLREAGSTIAFFDLPASLAARAGALLRDTPNLSETEPWPESDHTLFWSRGVPCLAFTSRTAESLLGTRIHSPRDTLEGVSAASVAEVVRFIAKLLGHRGYT